MPRLRSTGRVTGSSIGVLNVSYQVDPGVLNLIENIKGMRQAGLNNIHKEADKLAVRMQGYARANAAWKNHPDLHPSDRYPSGRTARQNLHAVAFRQNDEIGIALGHGAETIMRTDSGREITYGGILESGFKGEQYKILVPTWDKHMGEFLEVTRGAFKGYSQQTKGRSVRVRR